MGLYDQCQSSNFCDFSKSNCCAKKLLNLIIWGGKDVPSQLPFHASSLYARNVVNLLLLMVKDGAINVDFNDEIIDAAALTHDGALRTPKGAK